MLFCCLLPFTLLHQVQLTAAAAYRSSCTSAARWPSALRLLFRSRAGYITAAAAAAAAALAASAAAAVVEDKASATVTTSTFWCEIINSQLPYGFHKPSYLWYYYNYRINSTFLFTSKYIIFPSHLLCLSFFFSLPPSRNSDPGSHSRLFSPPLHYGSCLAFLSREDFSSFFPRRLASNLVPLI